MPPPLFTHSIQRPLLGSDTEVAAIAAALERHRAADATERRPAQQRASPWVRAARLEGRGHAPVADRVEVIR